MLKNKKVFYRKATKKVIWALLFLAFLFLSFIYISPERTNVRSAYRANQLQKTSSIEGNTERTDYYNEDNDITIASDLGYATKITTKTDGKSLEKYYDETGKPIISYLGYYAILREYDNNENAVRISYLDDDNNPTDTYYGYAIEEREYNEKGQIIKVKYYNTAGEPVLTSQYGYGKINEYDNNSKLSRTIFISNTEKPMKTKQGYASIRYNYYSNDSIENGRVESEYYFDEYENPVSLSLGQFGVHKEYDENGLESILSYLDADGNLIQTNKGYSTVIRTFQTNNTVATEKYYDLDGNPVALSEGQYGKSTINGQTTYLNQNGSETVNLRNILYNHSWIVIFLAILFVVFLTLVQKRWDIAFLAIYLFVIGYLTLMFRENSSSKPIRLFESLGKVLSDCRARSDFFRNIWLFIPLGAILCRIYPDRKMLLIPFGLSILIEILQYLLGTGFCEINDIICNTLGGIVGYAMEKKALDFKSYIVEKRLKIQG